MSSGDDEIEILATIAVTKEGGKLLRCKHASTSTKTDMIFAVFLPSTYQANKKNGSPTPALYYLSGLTCTDENFCQKAGAFLPAERRGVALVVCDTSPRGGDNVPSDDAYDLGSGAGFYINATADPWKQHYQMESYVQKELTDLVARTWNVGPPGMRSITGHSMGGHGALTLAFKFPDTWVSVSAFAPICHPTACPWGKKAFEAYLGSVEAGRDHDATLLLQKQPAVSSKFDDILIDEGTADNFGKAGQLLLSDFEKAAETAKQKITARRQPDFDHSYYFIAAFVSDHIDFHADRLWKKKNEK